jgi:hypothetical protein
MGGMKGTYFAHDQASDEKTIIDRTSTISLLPLHEAESIGEKCDFKSHCTWIPSDAAQAFNTSGSTAMMATREEFKLSPVFK